MRLVAPRYLPLIVSAVVFPLSAWQALRRNYPILAHFRFFFESIRLEIRQYFLEDDTVAAPFSPNHVKLASALLPYLEPGELLDTSPLASFRDQTKAIWRLHGR